MTSPPVITLTTDFGLADAYVATMKGAILTINPHVVLVDVSHGVRPQQVRQAAFLLETAVPHLPTGAIHLAVVDPGVGTERRAIAIQTPRAVFVGPDNGLLSGALPDDARPAGSAATVPLPGEYRCSALTNPRFHRQPVSDTFHGRDIFAPAAAHLSLGLPISELGDPVNRVIALPPFHASILADGSLSGAIIHIDTFGNLITDIRSDDLPPQRLEVNVAGRNIPGLAPSYASAPALKALVGGSDFLEIALQGGSAARELGADIDDPVTVATRP